MNLSWTQVIVTAIVYIITFQQQIENVLLDI